jgi:hypothetical protein
MREVGSFMELNYREAIYNAETGETTFRDYTEEEIAEVQANQIAANLLTAQQIAKEEARIAILQKLGLTEEEAKLLLG